jgi:hypothetical protein
MRRVLVLVSLAVTSMVALAFVLPLAIVVRDVARDRAFSGAELQAAALEPALAITTSHQELERALLSTQAGAEGRIALELPGTVIIGVEYASVAQVAAVRASGRVAEVDVPGGYAVLEPVALEPAGSGSRRVAVIEVFLPGSSLSDGVTRSWVLLGLVAIALVAGSVLVADRLGARSVRANGGRRPRRGRPVGPGAAGRTTRACGSRPRLQRDGRPDPRAARRRAGTGRRPVTPAADPAYRAAPHRGSRGGPGP